MIDGTQTADRIRDVVRHWSDDWTSASFCLCVSGSYARREQTSYSDLDILVLHEGSSGTSDGIAEQIVGVLSREIEHVSVALRDVAGIPAMLETDIRSWLAQMDAVYLVGAPEAYCSFRQQLRQTVVERKKEIIERIDRLVEDRYRQYGNAIALLEPNIKNSAGTLRDIHAIQMLTLLDLIEHLAPCIDPLPEAEAVISSASVNPRRKQSILDARSFFLSVRSVMHDLSGHLHDNLDFELQGKVSDGLGYRASDKRKGVEKFMRDYYRHARAVRVALQLVLYDMKMKGGLEENIRETQLSLPEGHDVLTPDEIMNLFREMSHSGRMPAGDLIRALDQSLPVYFGATALRCFDEMLRNGGHVGTTLMFMHEHGYLSALLHEFSALEHYFQHNVYHFFTADEHTLRAIRSVETSLREDQHVLPVIEELEDRSVLFYAILLHDIAKPIDLQRHEFVGADMAPDILARFGRQDIAQDVAFLVRHHLRMEQLAFRRNIREISTVRPFVQELRTVRRLNLLYLLTLADMSALNPGVLTDWKRELLRELYLVSRQLLESNDEGIPESYELPDDVLPVSGMEEEQFSIAVQDILDGALFRIDFRHHRAFSEVTVFCLDRPMLLAQFSAALFGADCSIVDASIETRNDVVIDTFRVVDIFSGKHLRPEQQRELKDQIRAVCAGESDSERMFERYRRKWVRKLRRLPKRHVTIDVRYLPHRTDDGAEQTIIEVYAPDTFGLLYRLASELSAFGLNVVFAKIATRVDGVVDSFYVQDHEGRAFIDETRRDELRSRILQQIAELTQ